MCSSTVNARAGPHSHRSTLLLSFPMLPAPHILKRSCRGIRCHQPISHPLVDQGGVGSHSTQQHREASVQHLTDAATQTKPTTSAAYEHSGFLTWCVTISVRCSNVVLPFVAQWSMRRQWKNCLGGWFFLLLPFQQDNLQLWMLNTGHVCPLTHWGNVESKFVLNTWHWSPKIPASVLCLHQSHVLICQIHPLSDPCTQGRLRALVRCPQPPNSSSADTKTGGKRVCVCVWFNQQNVSGAPRSSESHHRMLEDPVTAWFFVSNGHFAHSNQFTTLFSFPI